MMLIGQVIFSPAVVLFKRKVVFFVDINVDTSLFFCFLSGVGEGGCGAENEHPLSALGYFISLFVLFF